VKIKFSLCFLALLAPLMTLQAIDEKEAEDIGTEVYIYGYPLVTSEISRRVMTNTVKPEGQHAPMNQFINLKTFPDATYKDFTTPNADTLYSFAWLDLSTEPLVLHLPDEGNRYYLMPFLSAWTDVFAVPGTRTTGEKPGNFAITGPHWKGTLPAGINQLKSPTDLVFMIGRTYCNGTPEDLAKVNKLQDEYTLTPLSSFGKPYTPPPGKVDPKIDVKTPVRDQVNNLDAATFFQIFAALLQNNPPAHVDAPIVAKMAKIGIVPGKDFVLSKQSATVVKGLSNAPKMGLQKIMSYQKVATTTINGWDVTLKTGVYGTNYILRALVAAIGLGANLPQDAIYPYTLVDSKNNPLDGTKKYVLHFTKDQIPPVKGFWSLTMYTDQYFFVANPINRFALGTHDKFKYNSDGSLDIYVQSTSPGKAKESNWLPSAPGPFILMFRLYWPDQSVLNGTWKPPVVQKIGT
jgi:hypothetical protein